MPILPPPAAPPLDTLAFDTFELTDLWAPPSSSTSSEGPKIHDGLSAPLDWRDHNGPLSPAHVAMPQSPSGPEDSTPASNPRLLEHLHQAYWKCLRQAHAQPDAQDWSNMATTAPSDKGALEDLTRHASGYESLYTLLGDRVAIDEVMAGLDPLGSQDLLQPEASPSILHLFAPPMSVPDAPALPTLTLREHHVVTADSAFAPPAFPHRKPEAEPMPPASGRQRMQGLECLVDQHKQQAADPPQEAIVRTQP